MDAAALGAYLHEHIPISRAMAVTVVVSDARRVVLEVPLEPNSNHRGTAFGGSVSTLATLAGWATVHTRLAASGLVGNTVIQHGSIHYDAPITGSFRAICPAVETATWERFVRTVERRGRGRIRVDVTVEAGGVAAARFRCAYVTFSGD